MNRHARRFLLCLASILGMLYGVVHASPAQATPICTVTQQFAGTSIADRVSPPGWDLVIGPTMTASCTSKWYVSFTPQCRTSRVGYQACGVNILCPFAGSCTPNAVGWGSGTTHTYDEPTQSPQNFTGYWNEADGFTQPGDACDYLWRVKETFKNGYDNTLITTKFTSEGWCP